MPTLSARPHRLGLIVLLLAVLLSNFAIPALAQFSSQAVGIGVGGDNLTRLLWNNPTGSISLWRINADATITNYTYPSGSGWSAAGLAVGTDNVSHILWNHTSGYETVWDVNNQGVETNANTAVAYLYPGYTASAVAVGPSNAVRVMWLKPGIAMSLWDLSKADPQGSRFDYAVSSNWAATSLAVGPDSVPRVLWDNTGGSVSLWKIDGTGGVTGAGTDPAAGWTAPSVAVDSSTHLLWDHPSDNTIQLWTVAANYTTSLPAALSSYYNYTDPVGFRAKSLVCGSDGKVRLLWTKSDGTAQVWVIAADGSYTAKTYSALASVAPYLSNLTVSPTAITGGNGTTGTVTLSNPAPAGGVTVALQSSNSAVVVPTNVFIPGGMLGMNFPITSNSVASADSVTISGTLAGWTQSAPLTILSTSLTLSVQNLDASAGNGLVELSWQDLPEGSIRGYNVYRMNGATTTLLTSAPQTAPLYADTGLTNGTSYQYKVSIVNLQGQEATFSSTVTATPLQTSPTINWVNPPNTGSDMVGLYASVSSGVSIGTMLLVDGNINGSAGEKEAGSTTSGTVQGEVDTTELSNGPHTVQMIGYVGDTVAATVPLIIQVNNPLSNFSVNEVFQQDQNEMCSVNGMLPAGTIQWTTQIINDANNNIVRTWQAATPTIHLSWDGKDSTGTTVTDGSYTVQIIAQSQASTATHFRLQPRATNSVLAHKPVALIKGAPNAVALVSKISTKPADDQTLATTISGQLARMKTSNPGFSYTVLVSSGNAPKHIRRLIKKWMQTTVTDFYIFGHGSSATPRYPPCAYWGGANFWGGNFPSNSDIARDSVKSPELHFIVPLITAGRQYNFAMIDGCESAGGDGQGNIATPDFTWANAFNIGTNQNFSSCFFGWDGGAGLNTFYDGTSSNWLKWRQLFWTHLADGGTVYQSAQYASMHTPPPYATVNPWDLSGSNYRAQEEEDTNLP